MIKHPEAIIEDALVSKIDDSMTFLRDLHPSATSCFTYLVEHDGKQQVLKIRRKSTNVWDDRYFYLEIHALRRAKARNLKNMTQLLAIYQTDRHEAILKTYASGRAGNAYPDGELLTNPDFVEKLDAIYLSLHHAGISNVKFQPRKVVISDDEVVQLVDLSTCVVNTEVGILQFSQCMRADSRYIYRLEKIIRQIRRSTGTNR